MLTIDKDNNITMTRGDTAVIDISVVNLDSNTPYLITAQDTVMFTIREFPKRNATDDEFILQVEAPLGKLTLNPDDTKDVAYITYHYDIQITLANLKVYTIVEWRKITFGKEST
jgi:hypothetical protein